MPSTTLPPLKISVFGIPAPWPTAAGEYVACMCWLTDAGMSDFEVALVVNSVRGDDFATLDALLTAAEGRAGNAIRIGGR